MSPSGSIFDPVSPEARAISDLFVIALWICAAIFAVVSGLVGYRLVKYRWHEGERDPAQTAGNQRIEIVWTVISFGIDELDGLLDLLFALVFFVAGGLDALFIRRQLAIPNNTLVPPDTFNRDAWQVEGGLKPGPTG